MRTSVCSDPILLKHVFKFKKDQSKTKKEPFPPAVINLLKPTADDNIKWIVFIYVWFILYSNQMKNVTNEISDLLYD